MQKRYHFGNEELALSFEMRTGEIIEFVNRKTGENLLKCHSRRRGMPFRMTLLCRDGTKLEAWPIRNMTLFHMPEYYARYLEEEAAEGKRLTIHYPGVETEKGILRIEIDAAITLLSGSSLSRWELFMNNLETDYEVEEALFPSLSGIYLGQYWQDDALLYPLWRGIRIENPVETMPRPSARVGSRWMEYFQSVETDHVTAQKNGDGAYQFGASYGNCCCMRFMALYDKEETFYFGSHDPSLRMVRLRAETFGPELAGMNFSFGYVPDGKSFSAPPAYVGLFSDWHEAARFYGRWLRQANPADAAPSLPEWTDVYADMVTHYDFKDQCGDIQHRYADLPSLKDFCLETGLRHLMLAGWDRGGFNVNMPWYRYDPELGTEAEFRAGVRALRDAGIHVVCYVNADVVNREEEADFPELFREACAVGRDGRRIIRVFSNKAFVDYQMCPAHPAWNEHLRQCVHYLTDTIGIDGIYFDCLSGGEMCFSRDHGHAPGEHTLGKRRLLERLTKEYTDASGHSRLVLFGEGVTDVLGPYLSGQLATTFMHHKNAFPELYRYTFPEQMLIDMVYPFRGQGMRAAPVSYWWKELIDRVYLTGMNFWLYDDEEYGSFRNDPEAWQYLKRIIALRTRWFSSLGRGSYEDDAPFSEVVRGRAKAYSLRDGTTLIAVIPEDGRVCVRLRESAPLRAEIHTFDEVYETRVSGRLDCALSGPAYAVLR